MSKELFGDQQFHLHLRQIVVNFIHHNSILFQPLLRAPEHENDIVTIETHCTQMLREGEFARDGDTGSGFLFTSSTLPLYQMSTTYNVDMV